MYKVMFRTIGVNGGVAVNTIIESFSTPSDAETAIRAVNSAPPSTLTNWVETQCIKLYR